MNSAIQIIDENKIFKTEDLELFFETSTALSNSYSPVVAVFGSQSSGKSTLLNYLFDTKFDVMNNERKTQTTHGIWLAIESRESIIILDVEGSDGRERGDDKDFERKAALFALAIADVLIINIWENSIGLYNASNLNLLKTVLEVFFEIYSSLSASKTTILFVIRDYVGTISTTALENVLNEEIYKIWESIEKPQDLRNKTFDDVFLVQFAFLPHKIFRTNDFLSAIDSLRETFFARDAGHIDYKSSKQILFKDFPEYSSSIWNIVCSNKSLDLPTQQELLAEHRCEEAIAAISSYFAITLSEINNLCVNDELDIAIERLSEAVRDAEKEYSEKLNRYPIHVVQAKNEMLLLRLRDLIDPFLKQFSDIIEKKSLQIFEHDLNISKNSPLTYSIIKESVDRALSFYKTSILQFSNFQIGLSVEKIISNFCDKLNHISELKIEDSFSKIIRVICKKFKSSTCSLFGEHFNKSSENFWLEFEGMVLVEIAESLKEFDSCTNSFSDTDIYRIAKNNLQNELVSLYRDILLSESNKPTMIFRLSKNFNRSFRFDSNDRPLYWESLRMIDEAYDTALNKTVTFIDVFSIYNPSEDFSKLFPEFDKEIIILPDSVKNELLETIKREAEAMFLDAKRALVSGSNSIPAWVIILLIILGWNEFVAIISSPLYIFVTLLLLSIVSIIYHLNLTVPILTVCRNAVNYFSNPIESYNISHQKAKNE